MSSRVLRLTLLLLVLAAIGGAGYHGWTLQQRIDEAEKDASAFNDARISAVRAAFDLRSAQQAYVAAGQNKDFWFQKVTAAAAAIRSSVDSLAQDTTSAVARTALAEATTYLDEFEEQDRRVRNYASSGQDLLASDVIFSDGRDSITQMLAALDLAADAATRERTDAVRLIRREQLIAAGAAVTFALLVVLVLTPLPRAAAATDTATTEEATSGKTLDLDLRPTPRYVVTQPVTPKAAKPSPEKAQEKPKQALPSKSAPSSVRLDEVARVCSDLARLSDTSSIPGILERTATALDASGLVLWVADAEGAVLTPIAAHGYPASQFDQKNIQLQQAILGNTLEAIVGAVYLDKGYLQCKKFVINKLIVPNYDLDELVNSNVNFKSKLIEWGQREGKPVRFEIVSVKKGKLHKEFTAQVFINDEPMAEGHGNSKKKAEQDAAYKTCEKFDLLKKIEEIE